MLYIQSKRTAAEFAVLYCCSCKFNNKIKGTIKYRSLVPMCKCTIQCFMTAERSTIHRSFCLSDSYSFTLSSLSLLTTDWFSAWLCHIWQSSHFPLESMLWACIHRDHCWSHLTWPFSSCHVAVTCVYYFHLPNNQQ